MKRFEGKTAIISGGSRGIGLAIARRLADDGANLALIGTKDTINETANRLSQEFGITARGYVCNVANTTEVAATFDQIIADFTTIDYLVNNAGITKDTLLMRMSEDDWDAVINVNLKGAFNCIKAITRHMLKNRFGHIVNISSIVGLVGNAGQVNYSAAKAGIIGLTKSVAREFASRGITSNAVAPGFIDTDMTAAMTEEMKNAAIARIPLGRSGSPSDIASTVAFLLSDDAAYITGQVLVVDGGLSM